MPERKKSSFKDTMHSAVAAVDTALILGAIKLATLGPQGVKNLLETAVGDPVAQTTLVRVGEVALSPRGMLGVLAGCAAISLIENLRAIDFFKGVTESSRRRKKTDSLAYFNTQLFKPIEDLFGEPQKSERGSRRFSIKYAAAGAALGLSGGVGNGAFASLPWVISGDMNTAASVFMFVGTSIGSITSYYAGRKFGYMDIKAPKL